MPDENQIPDHAKEVDTLKTKLTDETTQRKKAEAQLQAVYDDVLAEVPEAHRDMIPNLALGDRIKWVRAAINKGVFAEKKADIKVDQSRPKTTPQTQVNVDTLKPEQKMAMGYKTANV